MNRFFSDKKRLIIILTILLFLIIILSYIKTDATNNLFKFNQKTSSKDEFFLSDESLGQNEENSLSKTNKNKGEKKSTSKTEAKFEASKTSTVEKIALISEIKDPFAVKDNSNTIKNTKEDHSVHSNNNLVDLEKNIIAKELQLINKDESQTKNDLIKNKNLKDKKSLENKVEILTDHSKVPFELVGIIKNKNNSAALFRYQGLTVLKKENDRIDKFKLQAIKNKEIILAYQDKRLRIFLWEAEEDEN